MKSQNKFNATFFHVNHWNLYNFWDSTKLRVSVMICNKKVVKRESDCFPFHHDVKTMNKIKYKCVYICKYKLCVGFILTSEISDDISHDVLMLILKWWKETCSKTTYIAANERLYWRTMNLSNLSWCWLITAELMMKTMVVGQTERGGGGVMLFTL